MFFIMRSISLKKHVLRVCSYFASELFWMRFCVYHRSRLTDGSLHRKNILFATYDDFRPLHTGLNIPAHVGDRQDTLHALWHALHNFFHRTRVTADLQYQFLTRESWRKLFIRCMGRMWPTATVLGPHQWRSEPVQPRATSRFPGAWQSTAGLETLV